MSELVTAEDLRGALARHPAPEIPALPGRRNHLRAGVLVPVLLDPSPTVILTLRSARLSRHAGEVCFPGGRPDANDHDLLATALREAREELGIEEVEVLGRLSSMPVYTSDFRLEPYVAAVDPRHELRPRPDEVAQVLRLELFEVLDQVALEGIPFAIGGLEILSPVFRPEGRLMFGATAHTFYELLLVVAELVGRPVPPIERSALSWTDLRPDP